MPATALRIVQMATENTWGTAEDATVRLMGVTETSLSVADEVYQPTFIGTLAPAIVTAQMSQHGEASVEQVASYQDVCYWLDGLMGASTPSTAPGTTYVRDYEAALLEITDPVEYTMEYGTTGAEYNLAGALVTSLGIAGEAGGMWECTVEIMGKTVSATAMTTGLLTREVDLIKMADTKLYMDAWTGTMGTTEVEATLISFDLSADPQRHLKYFAGDTNPGGYGDSNWESQLVTVLEFNANAKALVDELVTPSLVQRQIRLKAATGTGATAREAVIDFAGTLVDGAELFDDRDGNMTVSLTWNGTESTQLGNFLKASVRNELATLP
jgi:hypothetical protein